MIAAGPVDDPPVPAAEPTATTPSSRSVLGVLTKARLVDLGRAFHPDDPGLFTYWAPWRNLRQRNIGWRIDYAAASEQLAARASRCDVLADFGTSDHAPVIAEL